MKFSTMFAALALFAAVGAGAREARADGCYICSSGSSSACADYCRYGDDDTSEARARCRRMGCRIGGTASCPSAANVTICRAPARSAPPVLACVAPTPRG